VSHGSPQFTPRQLLDAARRAEVEGKLDVAHKFYWHLNDQYDYTPEAAEARSGLVRIAGALPGSVAGSRRASGPARRFRRSTRGNPYRIGRALAALLTGLGWLAIAGSLLAFAVGLAPEELQILAVLKIRFSLDVVLQMAAAAIAGGASVLVGEAARALFDLAGDTRELLAIERARIDREPY
jgi:hypothetical protein